MGGSIGGSMIQSGSAILQTGMGNIAMNKAKNAQLDANQKALEARNAQYGTTQGYLDPYNKAGTGALNQLSDYTGEGGKWNRSFNMDDFQQDPGYQFRMAQGQKALERSAAAKGNLMSGGTAKALVGYGQEMGSQEYGNAFGRYQTERSNQYNQLMGLAGIGMNAASQQANYSNQLGNATAQSAENVGNIKAGFDMGVFRNWQEQDSRAAGSWSNTLGGSGGWTQNKDGSTNTGGGSGGGGGFSNIGSMFGGG